MLSLVLTLALIGLVLYLIEQIPMDATIRMLIRIVVIVFVILWLVELIGFDIPPPHWRRLP